MEIKLSNVVRVLRFGGCQSLEEAIKTSKLSQGDIEDLLYITRNGSSIRQVVFFAALRNKMRAALTNYRDQIIPGEIMSLVKTCDDCVVVGEMCKLEILEYTSIVEISRAWPIYKKYRYALFQLYRNRGYTPYVALEITKWLY